ncbi:hypothetical protein [Streptomyces sp. S.PB5]|uniref:hypothetical protein n=1 Tax=Streptomyces sp. S.PB5 TaxID=3020844 RepID=UPI0025B0BA3D|nr:hypothetical protein [Streptomyces sp. S.PB5]MDN3029619.1 hypothetical protein [Streptomyces sp. S.PB5]
MTPWTSSSPAVPTVILHASIRHGGPFLVLGDGRRVLAGEELDVLECVWDDFDRSGVARGSSWISRAIRELLTAEPEQLAVFLRRHLAEEPGVSLGVINGPAGPLYKVSSGGAHRAHPFRILGLRWMVAKLYARIRPRRFEVASVIDTAKGMPEVQRVGRGWNTMLERGLLHGRIRYEDGFADLGLDHAPAPWLLGDPVFASAYNTVYERVYPGALTEWGIPATALTGRKAWEQWLYD